MRHRWLLLAAGAFTLLFLGFVYGWSILSAPLAGEFGWTSAQLSVTFTISMSAFCISGVIGAYITRATSARVTLLLAAACSTIGYIVTSTIQADGLFLLYIFYGVLAGSTTGMGHNCILGCVNRWFPDRPGTSSGLLAVGMGFSTLVFGTLVGLAIEALGWRISFVGVGLVTAAVLVAVSFVMRAPRPDELSLLPEPVKKQLQATDTNDTDPNRQPSPAARKTRRFDSGYSGLDLSTPQMIRSISFIVLYIFATLGVITYLGIMGHAQQIAMEAGAALMLATSMVGIISGSDGISRILAGLFFDRFGFRISLFIMPVAFILSSALLALALAMGQLWVVFPAFVLLGVGFGSWSTIYPAIVIRFYGQRDYGTNLSVAFTDFVPASLVGPIVLGAMQTASGSYLAAIPVLLITCCTAIVLAFIIRPPKKP
jgi:OFA family oxalate/formate antiporter-like MFS transporter